MFSDQFYRSYDCNIEAPYIKCRKLISNQEEEDLRQYTGKYYGKSTFIDPGDVFNYGQPFSGTFEIWLLKSDVSSAGYASFHVFFTGSTTTLSIQVNTILTGIDITSCITGFANGILISLPFLCKLSWKFSCTFK
jgi:hypothetical protein